MADAKNDRPGQASSFIKGDWATARYVEDQNVDNLLSVVVNFGTELWAMRRRQMALESLLSKHGQVTAQMINTYEPSEAERIAWANERDDMIERVYAVLNRVGHRTQGVPPKNEKVPPLGA